jgi:hypothetical protein
MVPHSFLLLLLELAAVALGDISACCCQLLTAATLQSPIADPETKKDLAVKRATTVPTWKGLKTLFQVS